MPMLDEQFAIFLANPSGDPAPLYQRLHRAAPVFRAEDGVLHVTRHADVDSVAREARAKCTRNSEGRQVSFVASDEPGPAQLLVSRAMGWALTRITRGSGGWSARPSPRAPWRRCVSASRPGPRHTPRTSSRTGVAT